MCRVIKDVFCYANEANFRKHLETWLLVEPATYVISVPACDLWAGEELEVELVAMADDLIICVYVMKPL